MRLQRIFIFCSLLFLSCTSFHEKSSPLKSTERTSKRNSKSAVANAAQGSNPSFRYGVLWELIGDEQAKLEFRNVDNPSKTFVTQIARGRGLQSFPSGHWELVGFSDHRGSFACMNTSKKFVFKMKSRAIVYGGSFIIGCPRIEPADFIELKEMSFFNRYPFSGESGICEVIVGNNFANIKNDLTIIRKSNKLDIILGF